MASELIALEWPSLSALTSAPLRKRDGPGEARGKMAEVSPRRGGLRRSTTPIMIRAKISISKQHNAGAQPNNLINQLEVAPTGAGDTEHITECATIWSVLCFVATSSYTAMEMAHALSGDEKFTKFYKYVAAMAISFGLKPRRSTSPYKALLYTQYAIFAFGAEVSGAKARSSVVVCSHFSSKWERNTVLSSSALIATWLAAPQSSCESVPVSVSYQMRTCRSFLPPR